MKEELIISGRMIPNIDPHLQLWGWEIAIYLFLGGLAAGLLIFAAVYTLLGKEQEYPTIVKWATFLAPVALVIGLGALFLDLHHKVYFWRLYTTLRLESPMSWGAWTLLAVTPISIVWSATYVKELFPKWDWHFSWLNKFVAWAIKNRRNIAYPMLFLSIILGIYTGILLSAFNARPLWNTSILGPLFLTSGLSTAAATIMLLSRNHAERSLLSRIDIVLIVLELFLITHMVMGLQAGSQTSIEAANLFLGGQFTIMFWVFIVFLGLVVPLLLEVLELKGYKIPVIIPASLVLLGGVLFRFLMIEAGQVTRYLY